MSKVERLRGLLSAYGVVSKPSATGVVFGVIGIRGTEIDPPVHIDAVGEELLARYAQQVEVSNARAGNSRVDALELVMMQIVEIVETTQPDGSPAFHSAYLDLSDGVVQLQTVRRTATGDIPLEPGDYEWRSDR